MVRSLPRRQIGGGWITILRGRIRIELWCFRKSRIYCDMPFLDAAKNYVNSLKAGSTERLVLEFLLKNGVGHKNTQPWSTIENHLQKNGIFVRQQTFQQGLLKRSRSGDVFIGSND